MSQRRTTPRPESRGTRRSAAVGGRRGVAGEVLSADRHYWYLSTRPLHALVFLAPLVLLYEAGSVVYLTDGRGTAQGTIQAHKLLGDFFDAFGVAGLFVPGVAMATVLVLWHLLSNDRWRVSWRVIAGMLAESAVWTLPLLVMAALYSRASASTTELVWCADVAGDTGGEAWRGDLLALPWQARLTISIGAGLYEEMLFRLVGIALLHFVLADLLGVKPPVAGALAVLGSALAFGLYHDTSLPNGGADWAKLLFLVLAGVYLGAVFVLRGFGIAVGTHALYDALVLVFLPSS